jgi:hypothetical protein
VWNKVQIQIKFSKNKRQAPNLFNFDWLNLLNQKAGLNFKNYSATTFKIVSVKKIIISDVWENFNFIFIFFFQYQNFQYTIYTSIFSSIRYKSNQFHLKIYWKLGIEIWIIN